ncbi:MAG: hypothetical protein H6624_03975 [Bdellovibrionaceae bacterium]|nr:hypothetical protein [Bdellovibrionales bacterium]MCB9083472.1 hypothetical protein [Pseudobdellovibrionaceae bacterium]
MASSAIFEGVSHENQRRIGPILIRLDEFLGFLVPLYLQMNPVQQEKARRQLILVLDRQSPKNLFRLHLFLRLMSWWPRLRYGRSFRRLPHHLQNSSIRIFFSCPIALFRKGFWGVNTLAKLTVYSQSSIYEKIGYNPKPTPDLVKK